MALPDMMSLLKLKDRFSKEKISVGLDIGTSTLKLVKLKFFKEQVELCGFALEQISPSADLESLLKKVMQSEDIKKVNTSVCGPNTIIRYVDFPKMSDGELKQALKFEASKYIPHPMDELNLDSYILKPDLADNKMLVLLAAAKLDFINQRLKLIQDIGLKANIIDIDSTALINAFNFNYSQSELNLKNKSIALLNIGQTMSNLNILEDGIPYFSRDIHIAGNNFTQKLSETFELDFKSAEELKLNPDKEKIDKVIIAVESVLSNLATEVRTSFDYYESQSASTVTKIFLSGGGAKFSGLKDMLANLLGIEVEYWDPLKKINIASNIDAQNVKAKASQLAVAIGLALRQ